MASLKLAEPAFLFLKEKLEQHYKEFDRSQISPDPLEYLFLYSRPLDIELIGYLSSIYAYGNVKQIVKILSKVTDFLGENPISKISSLSIDNAAELKELTYRFYLTDDIIFLFTTLAEIYNEFGSLKNLFLRNIPKPIVRSEVNLAELINQFSSYFLESAKSKGALTHGVRFMFPTPKTGSACKRFNLFLRWMVREDELDFGIWSEIGKENLVIPIDTHIYKISKELGLTNKKIVNWKMAEEITANLKLFDNNDPIKYDFALCHIGMRKMFF